VNPRPAPSRPRRREARPAHWPYLALLVPLLIACAPTVVTRVTGDPGLPSIDPALAARGPYVAAVETGRLRSAFGCTLSYEVHRPAEATERTTVVLAHGFLRSLATMRGWAEHLASHGVSTAVVSFCNSTPFDGRHDRNAVDLRALADAVRSPAGGVLYAGFSAGGLAALLAAVSDPGAVGLLALDAVDSGGGGRPDPGRAGLAAGATRLAVPALFLAAEPSSCNATGNMLPVAARIASAEVVRIANATHCHFEDPYAPVCERLCGRVEPPETAEAIRAAIRGLATAWVLAQTAAP
jgi:pimeloyl-ACP methyl ester carboxylesterase